MRALVIGKSGQLARCLADAAPAGIALACLGRGAFDLADLDAELGVLDACHPDIVINAAAYTAVDKAETDAGAAFALNAHGPARLADFAAARGIPLIHVSTDYVFDGAATRAYVEEDATAPLNVYGRSKLEGERAILGAHPQSIILRTSWLFSAYGGNFVKTMLRLAGERDRLGIVADQFGCPTSAHELAACIWQVARRTGDARPAWGLYHYAGAGATNWADFAAAIFAAPEARLARAPQIDRLTTPDYPTPAMRPRNSVLDCTRIGERLGIHLAPWQAALADVLIRLQGSARA